MIRWDSLSEAAQHSSALPTTPDTEAVVVSYNAFWSVGSFPKNLNAFGGWLWRAWARLQCTSRNREEFRLLSVRTHCTPFPPPQIFFFFWQRFSSDQRWVLPISAMPPNGLTRLRESWERHCIAWREPMMIGRKSFLRLNPSSNDLSEWVRRGNGVVSPLGRDETDYHTISAQSTSLLVSGYQEELSRW